jgi:hypothetical protein
MMDNEGIFEITFVAVVAVVALVSVVSVLSERSYFYPGPSDYDYEWNLEFVARVAATAGEFIRTEQEVWKAWASLRLPNRAIAETIGVHQLRLP